MGSRLRWHFPTPIIEVDLEGFDARQKRLALKLGALRDGEKGINRSNRGGWHSPNNLHKVIDDDISWLIAECLGSARRHVEYACHHVTIERAVCTSAWAVINGAGDWNAPHIHLPFDWSGVVYVQAEEGDKGGDLVFFNPFPFYEASQREASVTYKAKQGKMILFPSFLTHMVTPYAGQLPRMSVAFNARMVLESKP